MIDLEASDLGGNLKCLEYWEEKTKSLMVLES